jgi:ribose transport system permease protein
MMNTTVAKVPGSEAKQKVSFFRSILRTREIGVLIFFIVLCILMSLLSEFFLKPQNIFNVLRGMSTTAIMAIGVTMVIITGGIDLSIGSVMAASGMLTARLMTVHGFHPWLAFTVGMSMGVLLGLVNGTVITRFKVNPFITTLGMMSVARGLTYLLASGIQGTVASNIPLRDPGVSFLGGGYIGDVPFPLILMVVLVSLSTLFLNHTVLGRQIYAIGSNEAAARLSGVHVNRVKLFVYTLTGGTVALGGIMNAGLLSTAMTNTGVGSELDVIAAVVLGGASLSGGEGSIIGAAIGAAIMGVIRNAFVLLKLPQSAQTIVIGVIIVMAVALDQLRKRKG